jgi:hypothetical protein
VLDAASRRWDTVHFGAFGHPSTYDSRMWSADRLHPSERGHRLVAHAGLPVDRSRPDLVRLAAVDGWYRANGRVAELDARTDRDIAAVLATGSARAMATGFGRADVQISQFVEPAPALVGAELGRNSQAGPGDGGTG